MGEHPNRSEENGNLRFLFALPGFHQEERGAEVALLAIAEELALAGDQVTVIGAGPARPGMAYEYRRVRTISRRACERLPRLPPFRSETAWEDAFFATGLLRAYDPMDYDISITCNFPFTHWCLRRGGSRRPRHLFVTQNGDWPAVSDKAEFRWFDCDGLVCINPDYEEANSDRWNTALIPNGVYPDRFRAAVPDRPGLGLPTGVPVVLMVSALIESKRVLEGIRAVAPLGDTHLVIAGDGPLRSETGQLAARLLPGRFTRLTLPAASMPTLYRSCDAFLHMSFFESFGNVFVEAMASGLPVVAHDSPRLRWIVGDRDTLVDTRDPSQTTAALGRAIALGRGEPDPRVEAFAWPSIAAAYRRFALTAVGR